MKKPEAVQSSGGEVKGDDGIETENVSSLVSTASIRMEEQKAMDGTNIQPDNNPKSIQTQGEASVPVVDNALTINDETVGDFIQIAQEIRNASASASLSNECEVNS